MASPRKPVTKKMAETAEGIKKRVANGEPLSKDLIVEEHLKHYDVKPTNGHTALSIASTIAGQNLNKPAFLATLGLTDPQSQEEFKSILWQAALGVHPMFPKDKELMKEAWKLLAKGAIASREQVVHSTTGDMDSKSIPELRFYELNDRWPTAEELQSFVLKEYSGKPQ